MNDDIAQAFSHPLDRSKARQQNQLLDRISLRDHVVSVEIGAFQAERDMTQRISFNIVVEVRHIEADLSDDVDLILSYDRVTEAIDIELAAERLNLLETLAERVAERILREPQAERVFVRIEKLDRGGGALGVEIVRSMDEVPTESKNDNAKLNARVLFLANDASGNEKASVLIDQFKDLEGPLIVVVPPLQQSIKAGSVKAQNHIDLLEIEQSAWAFSARNPEFSVVATRTELDWASKNNQPCVWAPSKFVMDALESPLDLISMPVALAEWFAHDIGAIELVLIGEDPPKMARLACRAMPIT